MKTAQVPKYLDEPTNINTLSIIVIWASLASWFSALSTRILMARFNPHLQTHFAATGLSIPRTRAMGESSRRSDNLVANAVPRPRRGSSGNLRDKSITSMRDKMSRFREPSFRLLTGTRKLQNDASNKSLDLESVLDNRSVRFALSNNERIMIPNLAGMKQELWWTPAEIAASRAAGKLEASTDPEVHEYLEAFNRAYTKVLVDKRITSDCLRDLVVGLKQGHRGLEDNVPGGKMARKSTSIRSYVTSVVKHYHDCLRKELANGGDGKVSLTRYDSSRSVLSRQSSALSLLSQGSFGSASTPPGVTAVEKSVRNYSKKLSAGSRNFAQAMGRAEHLAAGHKSISKVPEEEDGEETTAEETVE